MINIPLILTFIRLIISPLVFPFLIYTFLSPCFFLCNILLASLFVLLSLTDFFDGYLARKYSQETLLGRVLDPVADKFLMFSVFITLLALDRISLYWVILFVGREFFVMGLRTIALEFDCKVYVSKSAKWKTTAQMILAAFVITVPINVLVLCPVCFYVEKTLLFAAGLLSVVSAYSYCKALICDISKK